MASTYVNADPKPLAGGALMIAGLLLALGNFMVVLDMTIANVSVPNIAGGLAVSSSQGTWVITSYSVAEAIVVPLTGWLAARFGAVRVFIFGIIGFGIFSALCGLAPSLGFLIVFRVLQGLCGGPIMPMSQTLLMRIFPPNQRGQAMGLWGMTTVVAPIVGPILGGTLCDNAGWPWIFYINVPVVILVAFFASRMLLRHDTPTEKKPVDLVGLALLITFVGSMQIMLDKGKELDWFSSPVIIALAIVAAVGFVAFVIWELTDANPIVNLRVFRHRSFVGAVITISLTFGAFFSSIVLIPLWLQTSMGYTATWSGYVTAFGGVLAVVMSPVVPILMKRFDARALVSFGVLFLGGVALVRSGLSTDANFWVLALPFLAQGFAMPFFFIPTNQIALAAVLPSEVASAAGLSNFLRTTSAAFATSIVTTVWESTTTKDHAQLAGRLNNPDATTNAMMSSGMSHAQALGQLDGITTMQATMVATDHMFVLTSLVFVVAAIAVWASPKVNLSMGGPPSGGH
jgi:DHA2 family multidrug resistance protein